MNYCVFILSVCLISLGMAVFSRSDEIEFRRIGVHLPTVIDSLEFDHIDTYNADSTDISAVYYWRDYGIKLSLYFYPAPAETIGPRFILDNNGNPIPEDKDCPNPYAVFKLTEPSETFLWEYYQILYKLEKDLGWKLVDAHPRRFTSIPGNYKSFISYNTILTATDTTNWDRPVPMLWHFYLFAVPGYFVKLHVTSPDFAWMEASSAAISTIHAIDWKRWLKE